MLDHPLTRLQTARERIRQRRSQMLVHSFIYYHLDDSLVDDHTWQQWADELRDLQAMFGHVIGFYDEAFRGWTGATGMHLPLRHPDVVLRATRVLRYAGRVSYFCCGENEQPKPGQTPAPGTR
jgi:hypothetical protein